MVLLVFLLAAQPVFADYLEKEQCATTDLSHEFGSVHNQLDHGWCWGFVAQDLMSFAAGRMKDPYSTQDVVATTLTTKPDDLTRYAEKQTGFDERSQAVLAGSLQKPLLSVTRGLKPSLRGNGLHTAVAAYSARGSYCTKSESKLSEPDAKAVATTTRRIPKDILDYLAVANLSLVPQSLRASKVVASGKAKTLNDIQIEFSEHLPGCDSPSFGASRFAELRAALNDKALDEFKKTVDDACKSRKPGPQFVPQTRNYDASALFDNRTNSDLAENLKKGIPVGISYNAAFLLRKAKPGAEYNHASIVVGTRWNENEQTCEFKIRNSWGGECSIYPPDYATTETCDNGNVWVKERDVLLNVYSSTTVRKN
jgi:hypothetical protein